MLVVICVCLSVCVCVCVCSVLFFGRFGLSSVNFLNTKTKTDPAARQIVYHADISMPPCQVYGILPSSVDLNWTYGVWLRTD